MKKLKNLTLIVILSLISSSLAHYSGPFLFWGVENLNNLKIPTLQGEEKFQLKNLTKNFNF